MSCTPPTSFCHLFLRILGVYVFIFGCGDAEAINPLSVFWVDMHTVKNVGLEFWMDSLFSFGNYVGNKSRFGLTALRMIE